MHQALMYRVIENLHIPSISLSPTVYTPKGFANVRPRYRAESDHGYTAAGTYGK